MTDFLKLTKEAYEASSAFLDTNYRPDWDYSIKAFRNEHASGSKYLSPDYAARSRIFRPKTRSIIRKNEAAAAAALFSNMEVADFTPGNPDDPQSVAGTAAIKEVVEWRMRHSIPAFETCLGGVQDAQTQGAVVSFQYWDHQVKNGKRIKDKPCIELRPIENIRLDGGASWLDPVNTSPYFCDILPMYVCDVKAMMNSTDKKTGQPKWKKFKDEVIARARPDKIDTTRQSRLGKQQDPHQEENAITSFDIVWVMRWFMKNDEGDDYTYYTLGTEELLTDPKPREEVYHHSTEERPYVMGYAILETHKVFKASLPIMVKPLQQETNDVRNQRLDNVKFVLNKRWIVARGRQVDVQSLVRNVPGGVTLATDPKNDVQESNWADVTSSSYVEEDRINADLDDLAGNFSPSTKVANNAVNDTLGGSKLAAMGAGLMTDYLLRTIIETWWEKVLRQFILLEQYYENDEKILAICAEKARLFPRFGISKITDDLLMNEVHVSVNVGMGSSNPNERMQKFLMATNAAIGIVNTAPPGFNVGEAIKEIYSNAGYRDGARFMNQQQDPRLMKAMQLVQQMKQMMDGKKMDLAATAQVEQMKLTSNERVKAAELTVDKGRIQGDLQIRAAELEVEKQKLSLEAAKLQIEAHMRDQESQSNLVQQTRDAGLKVQEHRMKMAVEHQKLLGVAAKIAADIEKSKAQLQQAKEEHNVSVANNTMDAMGKAAESISAIKAAMSNHMDGLHGDMQKLGEGIMSIQPKKKPSKIKLKKSDGKRTSAVELEYDDGTKEEVGVES